MKFNYGLTESMQEAALIARKGRELGLSYGKYEDKFPTEPKPKKTVAKNESVNNAAILLSLRD